MTGSSSLIPYLNIPSLLWFFSPRHGAKICLPVASIHHFNSALGESLGGKPRYFSCDSLYMWNHPLSVYFNYFSLSKILSLFIILGTHPKLRTWTSFCFCFFSSSMFLSWCVSSMLYYWCCSADRSTMGLSCLWFWRWFLQKCRLHLPPLHCWNILSWLSNRLWKYFSRGSS